MSDAIQAVIFDYGNVLCEPQQREDLERLASVLGMSLENLSAAYWRNRIAYDRADLDPAEYWELVAGSRPDNGKIAELNDIDTRSWLRPRPATLAWVDAVRKQGLRTALLSNLPITLRDALQGCDWMPRFDVRTYSCNVRSAKPDRAIYDACLRDLDVLPQQAVFLDDRPENIEGAARLGIRALLFKSVDSAIKDLVNLGVTVTA